MKPLSFSLFILLCASLLFFLTGCATGPAVDPQVTAAVSAHHVPQATYDKVNRGQRLDYNDIEILVRKRVPSYVIVGYLRSTEAVYNFTYAQLRHLRAIGGTPQLLNYLSETQGFYGRVAAAKKWSIPKYIKENSMLYQDQQPFFYNEPIVDDWYDSAYEESCYSPFSFN